MSKIRLLDLFEKPSLNLEKVYSTKGYNFICVPINKNLQPTDLCCCKGLGGDLWIKVSEFTNSLDGEKILYKLKSKIKDNTIIYSFLRRPVKLHNQHRRYLQEGDFFKEDDLILSSNYRIKNTSSLLGVKYLGVKYSRTIRKIELINHE